MGSNRNIFLKDEVETTERETTVHLCFYAIWVTVWKSWWQNLEEHGFNLLNVTLTQPFARCQFMQRK